MDKLFAAFANRVAVLSGNLALFFVTTLSIAISALIGSVLGFAGAWQAKLSAS